MLTGEVRNKIDKIWTDMWAGGITNPLTVIEQLRSKGTVLLLPFTNEAI